MCIIIFYFDQLVDFFIYLFLFFKKLFLVTKNFFLSKKYKLFLKIIVSKNYFYLKLKIYIKIKLLKYLREELVIVLATSSSESVLPRVIKKLENLGAHPDVVRLVVPTGYSFNLDGTAIYLTMAALFIAQATQVELNWHQMMLLLGLMIVTSKGAATVAGGGFITLAATLTAFQIIPVEGIVLILGIDRFMSEGRALTNVIGNSVAALFIAHRMGELDHHTLKRVVES